MADHKLKIHEQPFNDLLSGAKTCEVRNNDRGFQPGDIVQLHEIADTFTGRVMARKITHVQTGYGLPDGLCVLSYAQLPSQGGEAVEVVAWVTPAGFMHKDKDVAETHPVTRHVCKVEPLMAVGQHQRILAATTNPADQVAEGVEPAHSDVSVPRELLDRFPEINPANYGDDEVMALNNWGIEVALLNGGQE